MNETQIEKIDDLFTLLGSAILNGKPKKELIKHFNSLGDEWLKVKVNNLNRLTVVK